MQNEVLEELQFVHIVNIRRRSLSLYVYTVQILGVKTMILAQNIFCSICHI